MIKYFSIFLLLFVFTITLSGQKSKRSVILEKINDIRSNSQKCGWRRMPAVGTVYWNETLFNSAFSHAREMHRYNYFDHHSRQGETIGQRLDKFDYDWLIVGENIAKGQKSIEETLRDWMKSKTHCKMIMNPYVNEIGMAKSGSYRVMHFGRRT